MKKKHEVERHHEDRMEWQGMASAEGKARQRMRRKKSTGHGKEE